MNKQKKEIFSEMSQRQTGTALQMVIDGISEMEKQMSILIFEGSKAFSAEVCKQIYVCILCNKANIYITEISEVQIRLSINYYFVE